MANFPLLLALLLSLSTGVARARLYACPKCPACVENKDLKCPEFHLEKDFCECCSRCLKEKGEVCGGEGGILGKCLPSLFCDRPKQANSKLRALEGVCREVYPEPHYCPAIACNPDFCRKDLVCTYGFGYKACGCCPICAQGLDELCDLVVGCGTGLICVESYDSVLDKVMGRCKPWYAPSPITFPH